MTTWGEYRTQLRRSVLRDKNKVTWSDDLELRDFCWWAMDTFCAHTALASSVSFTDLATDSVSLPSDIFDSIETAGLVYLTTSSGTRTNVAPWYSLQAERLQGQYTFREWPAGTLKLSAIPTGAPTLTIEYFAYYPHPVTDNDLVRVPQWAYGALGYLIAAYAMTGVGVMAANIGQWDDRSDAGNPEHNPLRRQHSFFMQLYEQELARFPRQDRQNYWSLK